MDPYNNYDISKQETIRDNEAEADDENVFPSDELGSGNWKGNIQVWGL